MTKRGLHMIRWLPPVALAILAGLVTALPQLLLMRDAGEGYRGVIMEGSDSEYFYTARIREVYDGHARLGSADLFEYKQEPYVQPPFSELVYAGLARVTGVSATAMVAFGKFLFPALLFLVWSTLIRALTGREAYALIIPVGMMFLPHYVFFPQDAREAVLGNWQALQGMVSYYRPVNPQMSSVLFFLWLLTWYTWLMRGRRLLLVASSVLLGFLFYTYPYSWMLALGMSVSMLIAVRALRVTGVRVSARVISLYLALALMLSIPYWYNFASAVRHPWYPDLVKRWGFVASHAPQWSNLIAAGAILTALLFWKRGKDARCFLLWSAFFSLFLLINQQVVTGIRFFPGHWHWYYTTPMVLFVGIWFVLRTLERTWPRIMATAGVGLIIFGLLTGVAKQYHTYLLHRASALAAQRYGDVFTWVSAHTERDDIVLADGTLNEKLPAYTHANLYFSRTGEFYLIPHARNRDRLFGRLYLDGADETNVMGYLEQRRADVNELLFGVMRQRLNECAVRCFSDGELRALAGEYLAWKERVDFKAFLATYRLDYALWDTLVQPGWNLDVYPFFQFITEVNRVRIYRFVSS